MNNKEIQENILNITIEVIRLNQEGRNLKLNICKDMLCVIDGDNKCKALPLTKHDYIYWGEYWDEVAGELFESAINYLRGQ